MHADLDLAPDRWEVVALEASVDVTMLDPDGAPPLGPTTSCGYAFMRRIGAVTGRAKGRMIRSRHSSGPGFVP